jgi:hypothetical protein
MTMRLQTMSSIEAPAKLIQRLHMHSGAHGVQASPRSKCRWNTGISSDGDDQTALLSPGRSREHAPYVMGVAARAKPEAEDRHRYGAPHRRDVLDRVRGARCRVRRACAAPQTIERRRSLSGSFSPRRRACRSRVSFYRMDNRTRPDTTAPRESPAPFAAEGGGPRSSPRCTSEASRRR